MTPPRAILCAMRRALVVAVILVGGCGGASPTGPGPTPPPQPTTVTIAGRVTATLTGEPLAGASLTLSGRTVTTGADGRFTLDGQPPNTTLPVELSAAGTLPRQTTIRTESGRSDITLDLIQEGGAFSLGFYRQLIRNAHDAPEAYAAEPLRRWTVAPNIHLQSVPDDVDVAGLDALVRSMVSQATGGALAVGTVTSGSSASQAPNTITVAFVRDLGMAECGRAQVGAGSVTINTARCVCPASPVNRELLGHEIGHAMGFRHTADGLMRGSGFGCGEPAFSDAERYHARIAYRRQPGNLDIDRDAAGVTALQASPAPPPVVACAR